MKMESINLYLSVTLTCFDLIYSYLTKKTRVLYPHSGSYHGKFWSVFVIILVCLYNTFSFTLILAICVCGVISHIFC